MKRIIPCVLITLAFILAGSFLPVLGFICFMLCPLPLCVLGCVEGRKKMSVAELLIEATLFLVVSPSMAVYFLLGCAPISAMIFTLSREEFKTAKKYSGPESLLICTGASILFKLILIVSFWVFTKRNIFIPDISSMEAVMAQLYGNEPELIEAMRRIINVFPALMPMLLVIYCIAEAYLNYVTCSRIGHKIFPNNKNFPVELPEFKSWRFPVSLLYALVISSIIKYFVEYETWPEFAIFVMNLQIIIDVFMFIQGLALAFWLMDGFKFKRRSKILVCVILTFPFFWAWLVVMGMCDMALNMRERIKIGNK